MNNIVLIDTGAANIHSVHKALKYIGANVEITSESSLIYAADSIVFPGVGAFGAVMKSIVSKNLSDPIKQSIESKKPFLGICVGLQVLFEDSEEHGHTKGLGIFKGKVIKFRKAKKIPHIGWNSVNGQGTSVNGQDLSLIPYHSALFYFVHSYYVIPEDKSIICGETEYDGERFVSGVKKDNLIAVQFHPEKSGEAGLEFLKKFVSNDL